MFLSKVTITTSEAHGFIVGETVNLAGVSVAFDGARVINEVTSTTFSFQKANASAASTTLGTPGTATVDLSPSCTYCNFGYSVSISDNGSYALVIFSLQFKDCITMAYLFYPVQSKMALH